MSPARSRNLSKENDDLARKWAGPFGYAVLQTLRLTDHFGEADFAAFARQAPVERQPPRKLVEGALARQALEAVRAVEPQVTMSEEHPYGGVPDFAGDPPYVSQVGAGRVLEPAPPAEFYRRVTTAGRPGQPPAPSGRRDASGRYVRPAR